MKIYACTLCGYEYVEEDGDVENGIEEGTEFDDIPADWVCPVCGATKEEFELVDTDEE